MYSLYTHWSYIPRPSLFWNFTTLARVRERLKIKESVLLCNILTAPYFIHVQFSCISEHSVLGILHVCPISKITVSKPYSTCEVTVPRVMIFSDNHYILGYHMMQSGGHLHHVREVYHLHLLGLSVCSTETWLHCYQTACYIHHKNLKYHKYLEY